MAEALVEKPLDALDDAVDVKEDVPAVEASDEHAQANGDVASAPRGRQNLYFVRVPRPQIDDAPVKELQTKLTATLAKLKEYNSKLSAKREEVAGLRKQVGVARSLKEEAAPEWQDKVTKLQELKDIRKSYLDEIATIKQTQSGLEARTEEELDAKLAAMEAEIAHGQLELREEKQMVRDISRLKSQRDRVREAEGRHAALTQLEGELSKVKATIKELDTEVTALRGERSQAVGILQEIQGKLREVNDAISELEAERGEHEAKKKALQDAIRAAQDESSEAMQEWRENRKFSLTVRDLVDSGKLDEARAMCEEQVASYMARLLGDKQYRKEYIQGWSEQRKYVVSDLLPGSGVAQDTGRGAQRDSGRGGRGSGSGAAVPPRGEPKVEGAVKAAALIEKLMQQAQATVAAQRAAQPAPLEEEDSGEAVGDAPEANAGAPEANGGAYKPPGAAAAREVPGATEDLLVHKKSKPKAAGSGGTAAAVKQAVELPKVPDLAFEVPVGMKEAAAEADLTEAQKKELIREENRRKAAEAEARKKRREEAAQRKKQAAEAAAARKAEEPPAPAPAQEAPATAAPSADEAAADEDAAAAAPAAAAPAAAAPAKQQKQQKVQQRKPKGAPVIKPEPVVKRPRGEEPAWKKALKAVKLDSQTNQAIAFCVVIMLLIFLMLLR